MYDADQQAEMGKLLDEICQPGRPTSVMAGDLIKGVQDAVQAQREWAEDMLDAFLLRGASHYVKAHLAKLYPPVPMESKAGEVYAMFKILRGRRVDGVWVQDPILGWDWDDVQSLRVRVTKQRNHYAGDVQAADRLLALRDRFPLAASPAEACELAGLSIEDVIGGGES